jgi:hypothetical protein
MRYLIPATILVGGYLIWRSRQTPYAGLVSSGWGGNAYGNLPGLFNPRGIVGMPVGANPPAPPGNPFGPSTTTNGGSSGP